MKTTSFSKPSSLDMNGLVFLTTGEFGNVTMGYACVPFIVVNEPAVQTSTAGSADEVSIDSRQRRITTNPNKAAALARARARIGNWVQSEPTLQSHSLAALRLRAGLSQRELAEKLDTSQPNVARMEKSPGNPTLASMKAWAGALGVGVQDVVTAIEAQSEGSE